MAAESVSRGKQRQEVPRGEMVSIQHTHPSHYRAEWTACLLIKTDGPVAYVRRRSLSQFGKKTPRRIDQRLSELVSEVMGMEASEIACLSPIRYGLL